MTAQHSLFHKGVMAYKRWYLSLEERERIIMLVALVLCIGFGLFSAFEFSNTFYESQIKESKKLEDDLAALPLVLERYEKLSKRLENTEQYYKSIVFGKTNVDSYLETLIREKASITDRYDIKELGDSVFAEDYVRSPRRIRLTVSDFTKLVDFLEAVVGGEHPLLISSLKLSTDRRKEKLSVEVVVDSIQRAS